MRRTPLLLTVLTLCAPLALVGCGGSTIDPGTADDTGVASGDTGVATDGGDDAGGDGGPADASDSGKADGAGDGVADGGDGGPSVSADKACSDLAAAYCGEISTCAPIFIDFVYGDVATCTSRLKAECLLTIGAPSVAETPSATEACASSISTLTCSDAFAKKSTGACVPIPGDRANGKPCGTYEQCSSGFCPIAADASCGTCAPSPHAGDPCVAGTCGQALDCVSGKCQHPGTLGDACDPKATPCATSLSCRGGTCIAAAKAGEACDEGEVAAPKCDGAKGLFCNGLTKVCQKLGEAKAGEACGLVGSDVKVCVGGAFCRRATGTTFTGTCVAVAADGAACNETDGPHCLAPAKCVGGTCKLPDPTSCK